MTRGWTASIRAHVTLHTSCRDKPWMKLRFWHTASPTTTTAREAHPQCSQPPPISLSRTHMQAHLPLPRSRSLLTLLCPTLPPSYKPQLSPALHPPPNRSSDEDASPQTAAPVMWGASSPISHPAHGTDAAGEYEEGRRERCLLDQAAVSLEDDTPLGWASGDGTGEGELFPSIFKGGRIRSVPKPPSMLCLVAFSKSLCCLVWFFRACATLRGGVWRSM